MALPKHPLGDDARPTGPGLDFFYLLTTYNDTLPVATIAASQLPFVLRAIRCLTDCTISVQSLQGNVVEYALAAGDSIPGYIVAVSGVPDNTSLVGYV